MCNFLLKVTIIFLLSTLTIGCLEVDFEYIQITSSSDNDVFNDYDKLYKEVSSWPEFKMSSKCENSGNKKIENFIFSGAKYISVATIVDKDTHLVVLSFTQLGGFDDEGTKLFDEITSRIKAKFGEEKLLLLVDRKSGKYKMADFIRTTFEVNSGYKCIEGNKK